MQEIFFSSKTNAIAWKFCLIYQNSLPVDKTFQMKLKNINSAYIIYQCNQCNQQKTSLSDMIH